MTELNLNLPEGVEAKDEDILGSGKVLESGAYKGILDMVYLDASDTGSLRVTLHLKRGNRVDKLTTYISNRAGGFTYKDKRTQKDKPLPGYALLNSMFYLLTGKGLGEQTMETKMVKVYDYDQKKEVPKEVQVFVDVVNKQIAAGILKINKEKTTKESKWQEGTGEFTELNEIDKFFDPETAQTSSEKKADKPATFFNKWKDRNDGKTRTKKAPISGATSQGTSGAPAPANNTEVEDPFGDD